jgi:hypothetical protein
MTFCNEPVGGARSRGVDPNSAIVLDRSGLSAYLSNKAATAGEHDDPSIVTMHARARARKRSVKRRVMHAIKQFVIWAAAAAPDVAADAGRPAAIAKSRVRCSARL